MNERLEFAKGLAYDAGEIMKKYFNQADVSHYKGDATIVTKADTEINQMVIDRVRKSCPGHGVYGEEISYNRDKSTLWVCDPIDGTAVYALGLPVAVFSLALVTDGEPIIGVVYDPFTDHLYEAVKDGPALCNGRAIRVSDTGFSDKQAVMSYHVRRRSSGEYYYGLMSTVTELGARKYVIGSTVRAAMLVATGGSIAEVFAGFSKGKSIDAAAAKVIVESAGGRATDIFGQSQRYDQDINGAIFSNGVVHDEIVDTVKEYLGGRRE